MNRITRICASLLLAFVMVLGMCITAYAAESSVTYEGGAEAFVFLPGSKYTSTDLFDGFKGVMPGDVRSESIIVQNKNANCDFVKIYMRAIPHDLNRNPMSEKVKEQETLGSMADFLGQLSMTVKQGDRIIYNASPNELGGLQQNVLLGEFDPEEKTELVVELKVPVELGNEYANRIGEVDWVFLVEELNDPDAPATGDQSRIPFFFSIFVISLIIMLIMLMKSVKHKLNKR